MNKLISVAIATYNRTAALDRLLGDLEKQTLAPENWEVIVVVDGSIDNTIKLLSSWQQKNTLPLTYFWQKNTGQSLARHNAIVKSQGDRIVLIDDDMEICPQFLEAHLQAAQSEAENIIVVGKVKLQSNWKHLSLYELKRLDWLISLHEKLENQTELPNANAFITFNVSLPRSLYFQAGGFDPLLRLSDDLELGWRLEQAGCRFIFSPQAWSIHHSDVGTYDGWLQREYNEAKYAIYIWEKHNRNFHLHPLKNLIAGSPLKQMGVKLLVPWDWVAKFSMASLQILGNIFKAIGLLKLAIATHKGIAVIQYHLGIKHYLGSWLALCQIQQECAQYFLNFPLPQAPQKLPNSTASNP